MIMVIIMIHAICQVVIPKGIDALNYNILGYNIMHAKHVFILLRDSDKRGLFLSSSSSWFILLVYSLLVACCSFAYYISS